MGFGQLTKWLRVPKKLVAHFLARQHVQIIKSSHLYHPSPHPLRNQAHTKSSPQWTQPISMMLPWTNILPLLYSHPLTFLLTPPNPASSHVCPTPHLLNQNPLLLKLFYLLMNPLPHFVDLALPSIPNR